MPALLVGLLVSVGLSHAHAQFQQQQLADPVATFPESFSTVAGLLELPDGRVLVADGLGQALTVLDMSTGTADTIGRVGSGPEEYRQPDGLFPLPGDSILLVDLGNGRLTALGPDFEFGQTWPIAQGGMGSGGGAMTMRLPRAVDSQGRIYLQGRPSMGPGSPLPDSAFVLRWDRGTGALDTLTMIKEQELTRTSSGGPNNQNISITPIPMSPQDGWNVALDGRIALIRTAGFRAEWITPDGRSILGPENDVTTGRVRRADKVAYMERMQRNSLGVEVTSVNGNITTAFRRGMRGQSDEPNVDGLDWPNSLPAFQASGILVSRSGNMWVERFVSAGDAPVYDVFNDRAELEKRVVLPAGRSVVGFGDGVVYLVRYDEFDLQWLEKYQIR